MSDPAATQSAAAVDQSKFKIKVGGVEKEITREEMIELAQKGDDYTRKTQALSEREKSVKVIESELAEMKGYWEEMKANPGLNNALRKTHEDYKSGKISMSEEKDRNLKLLDKKIEEARNKGDFEAIESLKEVKVMIEEVSGSKGLEEKIAKMEERIAFLQNSTLINLDVKIDSDLIKLKNEFGKELVEKYENKVRESAIKYPTNSVEKLFKYIAGDDSDFDEALLNRAKKKKEIEIKNKSQGSSGGGATTVTKLEPIRDAKGRVDFGAMFRKSKESGRI